MKNLLYTIIIGSILVSCSSGGDGGGSKPPANTAPSVPALSYPADSQLCTENAVTFKWSASSDAEGNNILYKFQVAEDNQFNTGVINRQTASTEVSVNLKKGQAYYWHVLAFDSENAQSNYSPTYSFYTEGDPVTNHLPFLPEAVNPLYDVTIDTANAQLEWTASDPDTGDTLSYDVYLDTVDPPQVKVAGDISATTFDASGTVQATTSYYWQVVVKDNKGGETQGQIWKFNTN